MNTDNRFSQKDNFLMLLSLIKIFSLVLVSGILLFNTIEIASVIAFLSLCTSLALIQSIEASYETDKEYYGLYSKIANIYNDVVVFNVFVLMTALILHMYETRNSSFCLAIVILTVYIQVRLFIGVYDRMKKN